MRAAIVPGLLVVLSGCGGSASPTAGTQAPRPTPAPSASSTPTVATATPRETPPATDAPPATTTDAALATDIRAANTFTLKLFSRAGKSTANAMVSGTSLRNALGIAYVGARGDTATEMATALGLPSSPDETGALVRAERQQWQEARGTNGELVIASRLWPDRALPLVPPFAKLAEDAFGAPAESLDFAHAPDGARRTINAWVAEKTHDKITDLLSEGTVDDKTRMVLTNAIWFKGRWAAPFPKGATKDEPFKTSPAKTVTAPMMHMTHSLRSSQLAGVGAKALELRYDGTELAMLIVLPDDPAGLAKLEASLTAETIDSWASSLAPGRVAVTLPRFRFEFGGSQNATLRDLGIKRAFESSADFSGIAQPQGRDRIQLSQVVQRTWVSVDELGTEAAAATGVTMSTTSLQLGPVTEFKADHPFVFFVRDTKRGRVLFAGRVSEPSKP